MDKWTKSLSLEKQEVLAEQRRRVTSQKPGSGFRSRTFKTRCYQTCVGHIPAHDQVHVTTTMQGQKDQRLHCDQAERRGNNRERNKQNGG